jgi:hypothetical protein
VIEKLKELMNLIVICIDIQDYKSAMCAIAQFTVLFEEFIQQNSECIFDREIADLNRCLLQMMYCIEHNALQDLREIIDSEFKTFLDDWDFDDNSLIN